MRFNEVKRGKKRECWGKLLEQIKFFGMVYYFLSSLIYVVSAARG